MPRKRLGKSECTAQAQEHSKYFTTATPPNLYTQLNRMYKGASRVEKSLYNSNGAHSLNKLKPPGLYKRQQNNTALTTLQCYSQVTQQLPYFILHSPATLESWLSQQPVTVTCTPTQHPTPPFLGYVASKGAVYTQTATKTAMSRL